MKQKFYQKKWFKIIAGVFIVLGIVGAIGGDDDGGSDTQDTSSVSTTQKSEKKTAEPIVVHNIGDTFTTKDFTVRINSKDVTKTVGGEYFSTEASGTFVVLDVTIKNEANKEKLLTSSDFKLIKGDVEYKNSTDAMIYLSEESLGFETINPGVEMTGKIAFDIPEEVANAEGLQLLFKNDRKNLTNI